MTIRVVVADDHVVIRTALAQYLESTPDFEVVGTAASPGDLIALLDSVPCDVAVIDYSMPDDRYSDGLLLLGLLDRRYDSLKTVLLTGVENGHTFERIRKAGHANLVAKSDPPDHIGSAIREAMQERSYFSPKVRAMLIARDLEGNSSTSLGCLTKREAEIVRLFAEGFSSSQIAERIGRSHKTTNAQKISAMKKLGLRGDADLYRFAMAHGLILASQAAREGHLAVQEAVISVSDDPGTDQADGVNLSR
ncbi:response regulator transcription factor [Dyella sp. OK004]|uniref:response regulator transcription factor n=1 Tax=Dyella sp. OK004 TaxID=1855292 RepID=UPI0015A67303|nr:response regulator transcription factor [Dyella sp. OK004]